MYNQKGDREKKSRRTRERPLESIGSVRVAEGTGRPVDSGSIMKSSLREAGTERRFEYRALESLVPLRRINRRGKERITNSRESGRRREAHTLRRPRGSFSDRSSLYSWASARSGEGRQTEPALACHGSDFLFASFSISKRPLCPCILRCTPNSSARLRSWRHSTMSRSNIFESRARVLASWSYRDRCFVYQSLPTWIVYSSPRACLRRRF